MKDKLTKEDIKRLANQLMFDLSDEEADNVALEFETLQQQLTFLDKINTDGVDPMIYPFEDETTFMREDEVGNVLKVDDALKNVKRKHKGYVVLPRVVK